jgi:hypothetical protein
VLLRAILDKIEDRLHAQKASSTSNSANGVATGANWDDAVLDVPAAPSTASSTSAQGLGFMDSDFLSAWSTPVTGPSSTAVSSIVSVGAQSTTTGAASGRMRAATTMRPLAANTAPGAYGALNGASGLGLLDMPTGRPMNSASGMSGAGVTAPTRASALPPPSMLNSGQPHNDGMGAPMGVLRGVGMNSNPQSPAPVAAAAGPVDPFADLLRDPVQGGKSAVQKRAQQLSTTWDPFA